MSFCVMTWTEQEIELQDFSSTVKSWIETLFNLDSVIILFYIGIPFNLINTINPTKKDPVLFFT